MTNALPASPSPWAQPYVGLPYIMGVGKCGHGAALVWRQEFGFDLDPPSALGDLRVAQRFIRAELAKLDWVPVTQPAEGDAVIMSKGSLPCHVGVRVAPGYMLHCTRAEGMVLTSIEALSEQGFHVSGCFRREAKQQALAARA